MFDCIWSIKRVYKNGSKRLINVPCLDDQVYGWGQEAFFIVLSNGTGLKIYSDDDMGNALASRERQIMAYDAGIAPKVLTQVMKLEVKEFRDSDPEIVWGYKTQVAKTVDSCYDFRSLYTDSDMEHLVDTLSSIGLATNDLHNGNLGIIGNRLVAIDFGDLSTDNEW